MSKKLKIIMAVVAGVVVLALGGVAVVMAAGSTTTTTTTTAVQSNTLFAKAAATLGVTEQQLTDAFKLANTQAENQRITQQLAQAVTKGTITQPESDAIKAWLAQKPTAPTKDSLKVWQGNQPKLANPDALRGILGFGGKMMGPMGGAAASNTDFLTQVVANLNTATKKSITVAQLQAALTQAEAQMKSDALTKYLSNAVTSGKLTQTEADQIQSWWNGRPAAVDKLMPNGGFGFPGIGRGGMMPGFHGMMGGKGLPPGKPPTTTTTTKPTT
jgi:hypothetical protein